MAEYTQYLTVVSNSPVAFKVQFLESSESVLRGGVQLFTDVRYSPVLPAFLVPGQTAGTAVPELTSVGFLFSLAPYRALGELRSQLTVDERRNTYFTEGLASILFVNLPLGKVRELRAALGNCPLEFWPLKEGILNVSAICIDLLELDTTKPSLDLPSTEDEELAVYVEQICASLTSLWASYARYFPEEQQTVRRIATMTTLLVDQYKKVSSGEGKALINQRKSNAIVSALVELSAALSYAVTQGTTGAAPILSNRSPFPHHSLLGVGGSVRALTKYTRYLEAAFMARSAGDVIKRQYSADAKACIPASIAQYTSGSEYCLEGASVGEEHFDRGGDFKQEDQVPLLVHFSLRHGFMETKFSITAASESLTAETQPQWTLMTLSHEVMHSRVRTIFNALFPSAWDEDATELITSEHLAEFAEWQEKRNDPQNRPVSVELRSAILNFCYAIEQYYNPVAAADDSKGRTVSLTKLRTCYARNKHLAIEVLVHFHDFYFTYASQRKMYMMSIWASWIKVAPPYMKPAEYLARSLATVACGTGLKPQPAFAFAVDILRDALDALEAYGIRSTLFDELRRLVEEPELELTFSLFKPLYYLIDQIRRFFASSVIAANIDSLKQDPFAEGSTSVADYSANIYVFGEGEGVSPIRFSLAALFSALSHKTPITDSQWLTAWNYMVISSQEVRIC